MFVKRVDFLHSPRSWRGPRSHRIASRPADASKNEGDRERTNRPEETSRTRRQNTKSPPNLSGRHGRASDRINTVRRVSGNNGWKYQRQHSQLSCSTHQYRFFRSRCTKTCNITLSDAAERINQSHLAARKRRSKVTRR
jgi:hypothetical protein